MAEPATYVQRRGVKGWKQPVGAISCTRGLAWGNPFLDLDTAADKFADLLRRHPALQERARTDLAGRVLMCWCRPRTGAPGEPRCHVQDVLIPFLNEGRL